MSIFSRNVTVSRGTFEKEKEYWIKQLSGDLVISGFPIDFKRFEQERQSATISCELPQELCNTILKMCNHSDYGAYTILLSGIYYLLYRYSNNEDIMIGSPIYRQQKESNYINKILVLRNIIHSNDSFKILLFQTKKMLDDANDNMNFPFESILEMLNKKIEDGRIPLFDTMVVCKNLHDIKSVKEYNCDCIFIFQIEEEKIHLKIDYNSQFYKESTMNKISKHFISFLINATKQPTLELSQIEILDEQEKKQLLYDFNDTYTSYPKQKTIHQLIEEQVERTPDIIAVQYENQSMTYRQMNDRSNQLARLLQEHGLKAGDAIGLLIPRSQEMIVGVLAILKLNAICVPLDISHPLERTNMILEDSKTKILLKLNGFEYKDKTNIPEILLDYKQLDSYKVENLNHENNSTRTCFYIYTSGSTGKPKGAILNHYGIINHAFTKIKVLDIGKKDVVANNFSINVIASLWQVFSPLFLGAKLVIHSDDVEKDPYLQFERIAHDNISIIELIPSVLNTYLRILDSGKKKIELPHLKRIALTSEETKITLVNRFYQEYQIQLVDCYGQTECSDDTLHYQIPINTNTKRVLIGTPSNNTRIFIINQNKQLQPIGVPGELCVSGDGLAKGYFRREELTKEKFIHNPYSENPKEMMYRTGDLARWLPDGNVEYISRIDYQVKIRGYRIELGEIESRLLFFTEINEAVVTVRESGRGEKYLCAYFTADRAIQKQEIISYLSKHTPIYMIPTYFIQLDALPLMPNGKINKRKLPDPEQFSKESKAYVEPRNQLERELVELYKEILEVDKVGIYDDFFELGGHSLKVVLLRYDIQKKYKVDISLAKLFSISNVKKLSDYIQQSTQNSEAGIQPAEKRQYYPLSYAQKRIFLQCQRENIGTSYNMSEALILEGEVDKNKIQQILNVLIQRHEILRTLFTMVNGQPMQLIHEQLEFNVDYVNLMSCDKNEIELNKYIKQYIQPFNLKKVPLIRLSLIQLKSEKYLLIFDLHHIISDGTSMQILEKEFVDLYKGKDLPPLRLQYKDFSVWQNQMMESKIMKEKEKFWIEMYTGINGNHNAKQSIPTDFIREDQPSFEGKTIEFVIDSSLSNKLKKMAKEYNATLYIVLLSALNILNSKYSREDDIIIGSPAVGRTCADVQEMLGVFFNMMAIRSFPEPNKSYAVYLKELRNICIKCYENQDYPFTEVIDKMYLVGDLNSSFLYNTVFIMQNMNRYNNDIQIDLLTFKPYEIENKTSKQDLQWEATERDGVIQFILVYNTKLYKRETAQSLIDHFKCLLQNIVDKPSSKIVDLQLVPYDEYDQYILDFNAQL